MKKPEDRRVRKTKEILKKSLLELMQQKPLTTITVKELVTLADLNRSTFYHYYCDVPDMVSQLENELFEQFENIIAHHLPKEGALSQIPVSSLKFIEELCLVIKKNALLCQCIFNHNGDISFLYKIEELIETNTKEQLTALLEGRVNHLPYLYSFFRSGCLGLLKSWMNDGFKESPEEIAKMTFELGRGIIVGFSK